MPNTDDLTMTPKEFRAALHRLGFDAVSRSAGAAHKDEGLSAAARLFGRNPRAGYDWGQDGPPAYVVLVLRLMLALDIDYSKLQKILAKRR